MIDRYLDQALDHSKKYSTLKMHLQWQIESLNDVQPNQNLTNDFI